LRQKIHGSNNRSGDELGKKGHKERKIKEGTPRLSVPTINIQSIRESLKGVEGYTHGKDYIRHCGLIIESQTLNKQHEIVQKESTIFEESQESQVTAQRQHEKEPFTTETLVPMHPGSSAPIHQGGDPNQDHEGGAPRSIEDIACDEQVELFYLPGKWKIMQ
jgi:hypothetical protein